MKRTAYLRGLLYERYGIRTRDNLIKSRLGGCFLLSFAVVFCFLLTLKSRAAASFSVFGLSFAVV